MRKTWPKRPELAIMSPKPAKEPLPAFRKPSRFPQARPWVTLIPVKPSWRRVEDNPSANELPLRVMVEGHSTETRIINGVKTQIKPG
jgi:hypothetical protein